MYANANFKRIIIIVTSAETLHVVQYEIIDEILSKENRSTRDLIIHCTLDPPRVVVVETARGLFDESVAHETGTLVECVRIYYCCSRSNFFFCNWRVTRELVIATSALNKIYSSEIRFTSKTHIPPSL